MQDRETTSIRRSKTATRLYDERRRRCERDRCDLLTGRSVTLDLVKLGLLVPAYAATIKRARDLNTCVSIRLPHRLRHAEGGAGGGNLLHGRHTLGRSWCAGRARRSHSQALVRNHIGRRPAAKAGDGCVPVRSVSQQVGLWVEPGAADYLSDTEVRAWWTGVEPALTLLPSTVCGTCAGAVGRQDRDPKIANDRVLRRDAGGRQWCKQPLACLTAHSTWAEAGRRGAADRSCCSVGLSSRSRKRRWANQHDGTVIVVDSNITKRCGGFPSSRTDGYRGSAGRGRCEAAGQQGSGKMQGLQQRNVSNDRDVAPADRRYRGMDTMSAMIVFAEPPIYQKDWGY